MKITLPGSIRSKKNSKRLVAIPTKGKSGLYKKYPRAGMLPVRIMLLPSAAYQEWEKYTRISVKGQYQGEPIEGPVSVKISVFYKGQRPDLSGCAESVGDCLEGIIWANDKQIESWDGSRLQKDNKNPRTEVEVFEYTEKEN